jgi:hemerythrin-like domain-containing protein
MIKMEYLTKIISLKHEQIKEEFLFYKDVISFVYHKNYSEKIDDMFEFFVKNILPHFKVEEIIFNMIESNVTIKEKNIIKKILNEHIEILKLLNNLKSFAIKKDLSNFKTKNILKKEFKKIVKVILSHAKKEDKKLLPIYKKYVTQETIDKILSSKHLEPYIREELNG